MNRFHAILGVTLLIFCFQAEAFAKGDDVVIKEIQGFVQIQRLDAGDWIKAEEDAILTSGDKVRSFLKSSALLVFPDNSEFRLRENTSLDIKDVSQNVKDKTAKRELKLNLGSLHYKVPPKNKRASEFKIHSSTSIVGITGTEGVVTSRGEGKPSENILIEGSTYNTNDQGLSGRYQTKSNIYVHDGESSQVFSAEVGQEAQRRMAISDEYLNLIKATVAVYKIKKDEGYQVDSVEIMIKQAFFFLEKRDHDLVNQMVQRADQLLEDAKKVSVPKQVQKNVADILEAIKAKEGEGYDTSEIYASFENVRTLMHNGYFKEVDQEITSLQQKLALLEKNDEGMNFQTYYQNIQLKVLEKEIQGYAVGEIKSTLRQSRIFYDQDDKPKAYQLLTNIEKRLALVLKNVSDTMQKSMDRLEAEIALKKGESYATKELELRFDEAKIFIKEEDFLRARNLVVDIEAQLLALRKGISVDWQLKINEIKNDVTYKKSMGYDLNKISGDLGKLKDYEEQGDLVKLEALFMEIQVALESLKLPAGFEANWQAFVKDKKAKEVEGYDLREVNSLNDKVDAAVKKGDIKSARLFLEKAQGLLANLKDEEPPKVQILSTVENNGLITIEGFVSDNTKVKNVSVNHSAVRFSKDGKFEFKTVLTQSLKELSVQAEDIKGNISAPVVVGVEGQYEDKIANGKITGVTIAYLENAFTVEGKYVAGGIVRVGTIETFCDSKGVFIVMIDPRQTEVSDSITITGINNGVAIGDAVVLSIADQWSPELIITKLVFNDNFAPALKTSPLEYKDNGIVVSGQVDLKQMVNIEGTVVDIGGEIELLEVADRSVDIRENGTFNASMVINPSDDNLFASVVVKDKAGNSTHKDVALDVVWDIPEIIINSERGFLTSSGAFTKNVILRKEVNDVVVVLANAKGETIAAKRLPIADVWPPELEIQDIRYENNKVTIIGRTSTEATVVDINKTVFMEAIQTSANASFMLTANYPAQDKDVHLTATNIEGKTSEEIKLTIGPPKDIKAPKLYVSKPRFEKRKVIIGGFVEDDSEIKSLTVGGVSVQVSDQGHFSHELESKELTFIEVIASDVIGNEAKEIVALKDKEPPQIVINTWEAKNGRLVIQGEANDNIAVREVRVNDRPIALGKDAKLAFHYDGALTERSKEVVIVAVDYLNNESQEGPRELKIPVDTTAPTGEAMTMKYGSPIIYAAGTINDLSGVKAVYVNGEKVELFDDSTYSVKVAIDVGLPKIELESPEYDNGKVIVAGKVAPGEFSPAKIIVEAEDLSGRRDVVFNQEVAPYQLNEMEVIINGSVVNISEDGSIRYEQPIVLGERVIDIEAADPFDNRITQSLELESNVPFVDVKPLEYNPQDESVILIGQAKDEDSGLYSVEVNGVRVEFNASDGSFSYVGSFQQGSLNVVVTDSIGNVTSTTKAVNPPDIWPPIFSLTVTPIPSVIGNPVYIEITSLDSQTHLPEILNGTPTVTANVNGRTLPLDVQGEGVNYIATLETTGLDPVLVTVQVEGADEAGNLSTEIEGTNVFVLVEDDSISPSFTFEINPSPMELGEESAVNVFASEDLKETPTLAATLPSGAINTLELASVGGGKYETSLTVPVEEGLGDVLLKLSGGEDLSGNTHTITEESFAVIAPLTETDLPLNIHLIEFLSNKFTISGQTASEAVVSMKVGDFLQNIIADAEGFFAFERQVLISELEVMHSLGDNILVSLKAHNYAGFESSPQAFEIPLPPIPETSGENFTIQLQPSPVGQGEILSINVEVLGSITELPRGLLYLSDGTRVLIDLQGQNNLSAQYSMPDDAPLGPAIFEVVAGNIREGLDLDVVLSTEWMQRLNKEEFFSIHASPDPLLIGNEAFFVVETLGDLDSIPQMQIILPDGQAASIPLQGSGRRFEGRYQSQANLLPGRAELVLNPGTPEEIRRPYGIEEQTSGGSQVDVFLFANPNPLFAGEPYDVNISLSQDIDFTPRLILRLADGRGIDIPLNGSAPANRFDANGTLGNDVGSGLAQFVLLDDQGLVMDRFPAHVSAAATSSVGLDIFVIPDIVQRLDTATIQLNSISSLPDDQIMAHVNYPDGSREIVPLTGDDLVRQGLFTVPDYVPTGVVTIALFDNQGTSLGSTRAQVVEEGHEGGLVDIHLDNPEFGPLQTVRIGIEAGWPLNFIPQASLNHDDGSLSIPLRGRIPGNRFGGEFRSPVDPIKNGRIEIKDDQGTIIGEFALDRRPQGEGDVIITPMPPVIGEPLSIKVIAPSSVDSAPTMRLIFEGAGPIELSAYGALPGDTFTASLNQLEDPLIMVEIIHEGTVVTSIPVDHLTMRDLEFFVDTTGNMAPCELVDLFIRADGFVPFVPQISVDFQGKIVEVPLSQLSPSEFTGRLSIPCDASSDNVNVRVYDPQGALLWQQLFGQSDVGQGLYLNAMPAGDNDVQLAWDSLRGIDRYEIRYGKTVALDERITNGGGNSVYYLSGLDSGELYFFQVAALKDGREIMSSDVIQTTVGATMRELHVTEYVDGTNIQLVWTEYPGADKYRVAWGGTPGALASSFELNELNYLIPDSVMGNMYYIKVFALEEGEVIGESREVFAHLQAFQSQGGDISVTPDPPVQGQDLQINIRSFDDLSFIPNVVVHLQDGDVETIETGFGRDFTAILPAGAFTSPINAIDVYDTNGQHMFGRPFSTGGPGGQVPMFITPDPPQIGYDLNVRIEFPNPVFFIPSLFVEFASETKQYAFAQLGNNRTFETTITGNMITSSVIKVWVEGPNGIFLGDRYFDGSGGGPGFDGTPLIVTPDPLVIGSPVTMSLDIGETVNLPPLLRIHFDSGTQEVSMVGTTPGQNFTYNIASLTSMISSIDMVDPVTLTVEDTWWPDTYGGPQSCDIIVLSEDPPIFGQPLDMRAVFPEPLAFTPTLYVDFENGPRTYLFPQAPGLYIYEMALPIAEMNSQILQLKILDEDGNIMCNRDFESGGIDVTVLTVNPDPPTIGTDLNVHVEFNAPIGFTPRWRLFTTGGPIEGDFNQGPGLSAYDQIIPGSLITLYPTDLEITDNFGNPLPGGELFFVDPANFTCTASFDPSPPIPYTSLTVTATYEAGSYPSYVPRFSMEFEGGGYFQDFPQAAGQSFYSMVIQGSNITGDVFIAGIGNPTTGSIDCGADFEDNEEGVDITIDIDPPTVGTALAVSANFVHPVPFVPRLVLEFDGAPDKLYIFPGGPGQTFYQYFVPVGDMGNPVTRILVEDPQGNWIPDDLVFSPPAALDYPHNLFTQTTGVSGEIKIFWDVVSGATGYKVYYGTGSNTYNESGSPIDITDGSSTQAIISGLNDGTLYFITVESYDAINESDNPEEVSTFPGTGSGSLVSAPAVINVAANVDTNITQQSLTLTNNGGTAANVKFLLDPLLRDGGGGSIPPSNYTISPTSANIAASGNQVFTVDLSIPAAVSTGNYGGTIKFYDDANSNSTFDGSEVFVEVPVGVVVTGGGGSVLTASPTGFVQQVSPGSGISQESIEITNTGAAVNVRFETFTLNRVGGGGSIAPGHYSITPSFINISASSSSSFNVNLNVPAGASAGDHVGPIKFYRDANDNSSFDTGEDFVDVIVTVDVEVAIDHIHMQADATSSTMGSPIFVTLTAEDSGHNKIDAFDSNVVISVFEVAPLGEIAGSWNLSTNNGPQGPDASIVEMFGGVGGFTVDSLEPETLQIDVASHTDANSPLNLEFLPEAGSTAVDFAIIGANRAPTGASGTNVWVAAIDTSGQVDTNYTGLVDFTVNGDGANSPIVTPTSHTFATADNGQFQVLVSDTNGETVTLSALENPTGFSNTFDIDFVGVSKYLIYGPDETSGLNFAKQGLAMNFTLRAADASDNIIRSYNKTANFTTTDGDAFLSDGFPIQFVDGIAEIILNNNVNPETVSFDIKEVGNPSVETGTVTANFQATDNDAPEIVRVEMDTPWIVHVYFNEDVDSATAGVESNYTGVGTVDKVCWYGDNVTLNLASPGTLGGTFNLTIDNVEDTVGNAMSSVAFNGIPIPDVDFQGSAGAIDDWFEIQASKTNPAVGETIHITVYHKNVCGYLTGSNNTNKNTTLGNVSVVYGGSGTLSSPPTTIDMSSGRADFDVTVAAGSSSKSITITVSESGVTTEILTLNIP